MTDIRRVITFHEGEGFSIFLIEKATIAAKMRVDYWIFEENEKPTAWSIKKVEIRREIRTELIRILLDELFRMADEQGITTIISHDLVEKYGEEILACPNGGCFETATYIIDDKEVPAGCFWRNPVKEDESYAS